MPQSIIPNKTTVKIQDVDKETKFKKVKRKESRCKVGTTIVSGGAHAQRPLESATV